MNAAPPLLVLLLGALAALQDPLPRDAELGATLRARLVAFPSRADLSLVGDRLELRVGDSVLTYRLDPEEEDVPPIPSDGPLDEGGQGAGRQRYELARSLRREGAITQSWRALSEAAELLREELQRRDGDWRTALAYGRCLYDLGRVPEADEVIARISAEVPEADEAHLMRARALRDGSVRLEDLRERDVAPEDLQRERMRAAEPALGRLSQPRLEQRFRNSSRASSAMLLLASGGFQLQGLRPGEVRSFLVGGLEDARRWKAACEPGTRDHLESSLWEALWTVGRVLLDSREQLLDRLDALEPEEPRVARKRLQLALLARSWLPQAEDADADRLDGRFEDEGRALAAAEQGLEVLASVLRDALDPADLRALRATSTSLAEERWEAADLSLVLATAGLVGLLDPASTRVLEPVVLEGIDRVLAGDRVDILAFGVLTGTRVASGDLRRASRLFERILERAPQLRTLVDLLVSTALIHLAEPEEVSRMTAGLELKDWPAEAHFVLGRYLYESGLFLDALRQLRIALSKGSDGAEQRLVLGLSLLEAAGGSPADAGRELRRAIELSPLGSARAELGLAILAVEAGDWEQARRATGNAALLEPRNPWLAHSEADVLGVLLGLADAPPGEDRARTRQEAVDAYVHAAAGYLALLPQVGSRRWELERMLSVESGTPEELRGELAAEAERCLDAAEALLARAPAGSFEPTLEHLRMVAELRETRLGLLRVQGRRGELPAAYLASAEALREVVAHPFATALDHRHLAIELMGAAETDPLAMSEALRHARLALEANLGADAADHSVLATLLELRRDESSAFERMDEALRSLPRVLAPLEWRQARQGLEVQLLQMLERAVVRAVQSGEVDRVEAINARRIALLEERFARGVLGADGGLGLANVLLASASPRTRDPRRAIEVLREVEQRSWLPSAWVAFARARACRETGDEAGRLEALGRTLRIGRRAGPLLASDFPHELLVEAGAAYIDALLERGATVARRGEAAEASRLEALLREAAELLAPDLAFAAYLHAMGLLAPLDPEQEPDPGEALRWLTRAARADLLPAVLELTGLLGEGRLAEADGWLAVRWLRRAASLGDPRAKRELALQHLRGVGVERSNAEALRLVQEAASAGYPPAKLDLARAHVSGQGVPVDPERALALLEEAAQDGLAEAQLELGRIHALGNLVPPDPTLARAWLERAAAQRQPTALFLLGRMDELGEGGPRDPAQAARRYAEAAELGHVRAQERLALFYLDGFGVPRDVERARLWLRRAAAAGSSLAVEVLAELPE